MTNSMLLTVLIIFPIVAGLAALCVNSASVRRIVVSVLALALVASVAVLYRRVPFVYTPPALGGLPLDDLIAVADLILAGYAIWVGWRLRDRLIMILAALQAALMLGFDLIVKPEAAGPAFVVDWLSLIVALLVSVVGPLIAIYALGYMQVHEEHQHLKGSRQSRFFAILLAFLGVMNALVFANRLPWLYLAWEGTTLASFLLISHDGTNDALASGARALRINLFGGLTLAIGIIISYQVFGTLSLSGITALPAVGFVGLLAIGCFVLAGFTKAAQLPFQSWLLGAMVAPTPVSALLHSGTMVKAGVYFILRLAPAFRATPVSLIVSLLGAFTFAATSALAFSQSNAKKVLAYSTIANLGLIIACAGVNTSLAIGAAMALIFFHGFSKALLFLCVGTIEQRIGSRDIEDMAGLIDRMPTTTIITLVGMLSVLLPPFGVLISKWAMMEAAARMPLTVILFAVGSALTLAFWTKWMARLLSSTFKDSLEPEPLLKSIQFPLIALVTIVVVASMGITSVMNLLIAPAERAFYGVALATAPAVEVASRFGSFPVLPALSGLFAIAIAIPFTWRRAKSQSVVPPYLCGENITTEADSFRGAGDQPQAALESGVYLNSVFGEEAIGRIVNVAAIAGLLIMFGVMI
ncbi:MAG: NADH-quinone oxidoreductase subunit L [Chloroflexota bacterium]